MNEIRAFIGHSFSESDKDLVDKFLKYFIKLQASHQNFSWESAENAEPRILSQKVLAKLKKKNVFIGICTKKERVIEPSRLSATKWPTGYLKGKEEDFLWKTSDWIIQEIGLATGLGLDLLLLIEEGVRKPGGIQGDVEYIPFERIAPEKSFNKILEMIAALSPRPVGVATSVPDETASIKEKEEPEPKGNDWTEPQEDWKREDFEKAMAFMIFRDNEEGQAKIESAFLATSEANKEEERVSWESAKERIKAIFGNGGDVEKLKSLAKKYPDNDSVLADLARVFGEYDNLESGKAYEAAARPAKDVAKKQRLLGRAAEQYARAEEWDQARRLVDGLRMEVYSGQGSEAHFLTVLRKLRELSDSEGDAVAAVLERIVQLAPHDTESRFSLAYQYSQLKENELALYHYLKIPSQERSAITWNNLGAAFDQLGLPGKCVDSYRNAESKGETLAMSNLGYKFLSEGFIAESQSECDRALEIKDYHSNIGALLSALKALPAEENDREKQILEKVKPKADFYRKFGKALSLPSPNSLSPRWRGPECDLELKKDGNSILLSGTYKLPSNPLGLALYSTLAGAPEEAQYRITYSGVLDGRAMRGRIVRRKESETTSASLLLTANDNATEALMTLEHDLGEIHVLEKPHTSDATFFIIKKLSNGEA